LPSSSLLKACLYLKGYAGLTSQLFRCWGRVSEEEEKERKRVREESESSLVENSTAEL
jgi:hypothetical protein